MTEKRQTVMSMQSDLFLLILCCVLCCVQLQPPPGRCLMLPICRIRPATEAMLKPYNDALNSVRSGKDELLLSTLSSLEALLTAGGAEGADSDGASVLNAMRISIRDLLADSECPAAQMPAVRVRADAAFKKMRVAAVSRRTGGAAATAGTASPAPITNTTSATAPSTAAAAEPTTQTPPLSPAPNTPQSTGSAGGAAPSTPVTAGAGDRKTQSRTPANSRLLALAGGKPSPAAGSGAPPPQNKD